MRTKVRTTNEEKVRSKLRATNGTGLTRLSPAPYNHRPACVWTFHPCTW